MERWKREYGLRVSGRRKTKEMTIYMNKDELLNKAVKPAEDAMKLHPFYRGKVEVTLKAPVRDYNDFAVWYTPGVAAPCRDIYEHKESVYKHTNKGNFVAVISDGTRVLGLGTLVLKPPTGHGGKALLFKYLGGVDAFPICLIRRTRRDHQDPKIYAFFWRH